MSNERWIGLAVAVLICASAIMKIVYGTLGVEGNSLFTAALFLFPLLTIALLGLRLIRLTLADYLYAGLLISVAASTALNGQTTDFREYALLGLSLGAYPAFRMLAINTVEKARSAIIHLAIPVVVVGAFLTAYTLVFEMDDTRGGHPFVLGFGDAGTQFTFVSSYLIIALTTRQLTAKSTLIGATLMFLPSAVFATALVRSGIAALLGALLLVAMLSRPGQRQYVLIWLLLVCSAIPVAYLARPAMTMRYANDIIRSEDHYKPPPSGKEMPQAAGHHIGASIGLPSCSLIVNTDNSVAIRRALMADAMHLAMDSGPMGTGLGSFQEKSCLRMPVHNSLVQTFVEFGWLGGAFLAFLMLTSGAALLSGARYDVCARFIVGTLAYAAAVSMVYGWISREILLFGFMGWAVGYSEQRSSEAKEAYDSRSCCAGATTLDVKPPATPTPRT